MFELFKTSELSLHKNRLAHARQLSVAPMMDSKLLSTKQERVDRSSQQKSDFIVMKPNITAERLKTSLNVSFVTFSTLGLHLRFCKSNIKVIFSDWQV